jgi:hypothetical protein
MRLAHEIRLLVDDARLATATAHAPAQPTAEHLPELLRAVLIDPNIHTDVRMRLQREIPRLLRGARGEQRVAGCPQD